MVPQAGSETNLLTTQVLSLLPWGSSRPGLAAHEHLQHYIKPASGLQPGSSACRGGGTGLHHTSRHLSDSPSPAWDPHSTRCPAVRAEVSEGQDKIPYAPTSVPSPPVLQGWSECIELLSLFILFCSSDDIFFPQLPVLRKKKNKRTYHPGTMP